MVTGAWGGRASLELSIAWGRGVSSHSVPMQFQKKQHKSLFSKQVICVYFTCLNVHLPAVSSRQRAPGVLRGQKAAAPELLQPGPQMAVSHRVGSGD